MNAFWWAGRQDPNPTECRLNAHAAGKRQVGLAYQLRLIALASLVLCFASGQESESAQRVYAQASKSVFLIVVKSAAGNPAAQATGFSVEGNRIVTNEHVVRGGSPYLDLGAIRLALKVVAVDAANDLAVLTPEGEIASPPLKLASTQPIPGTTVFAIGNPEGLEKSISTGVVAAVRTFKGRNLLQISAPISHGSSGGPVLTANGEVVGVAVGMIEDGQNLNFAVPAAAVRRLLNGEAGGSDLSSYLSKVDTLIDQRSGLAYSDEPDSPYQRKEAEVEASLSMALDVAGSDLSGLSIVADKALALGSPVATIASERLVAKKPTADSYLKLARSLKSQVWAVGESGNSDGPTLKKAESAIRSAFRATRQPTMEMYAVLADTLEDRSLFGEAHTAFTKHYELAKSQGDASAVAEALRGLIRTSYSLKNLDESDSWFRRLVETGGVAKWDWQMQAGREYERAKYRDSGDDYVRAADDKYLWNNWCRAAIAYSVTAGAEDSALEAARACIKNGAGKKNSDSFLASAHQIVASTLNSRNVFEEALSHAREAVAINQNDAFNQNTLAESLSGLRRFQEAINAAKEAIRLSDGKYSWMHFTLGSAYFEIENWQAARQSYEKAAELDKQNDSAAYNVALCYAKLSYYLDAASWFEEVLRRNPNHPKKQQILDRIQYLRK